ncbi:MAG: DsbA family protein [Patescibacteria group bacterium]
MSLDTRLKQRMAEAVSHSYYKPWRKRWWGILIMIFIVAAVLAVMYFIYLLSVQFQHFSKGDIYNKQTGMWITEGQYRENQKMFNETLTGDDPYLGSQEPLVYVIAYDSFACPYSKDNQVDIQQMIAKYGKFVRFIVKDFPTEGLHPNVTNAHLAADCANEQNKYWEYRDLLYANQPDDANPDAFSKANLEALAEKVGVNKKQFKNCLDTEKYNQEIKQDFASGVQMGVVGTPSYVINGNLIPGEIKFDVWQKVLAYIVEDTP